MIGLNVSHRPHRLQRIAICIERLKKNIHARRCAKVRRAIGLDGHGPQNGFAGIIARHAEIRLIHLRLGFRRHGDDAEVFNFARFYAIESFINILQKKCSVVLLSEIISADR